VIITRVRAVVGKELVSGGYFVVCAVQIGL
jgi:hypothetical protein